MCLLLRGASGIIRREVVFFIYILLVLISVTFPPSWISPSHLSTSGRFPLEFSRAISPEIYWNILNSESFQKDFSFSTATEWIPSYILRGGGYHRRGDGASGLTELKKGSYRVLGQHRGHRQTFLETHDCQPKQQPCAFSSLPWQYLITENMLSGDGGKDKHRVTELTNWDPPAPSADAKGPRRGRLCEKEKTPPLAEWCGRIQPFLFLEVGETTHPRRMLFKQRTGPKWDVGFLENNSSHSVM